MTLKAKLLFAVLSFMLMTSSAMTASAGLLAPGGLTAVTLRKSCEALLFGALDRQLFQATKLQLVLNPQRKTEQLQKSFRAWLDENKSYLRSPTSVDDSEEQNRWRFGRAHRSLERWSHLIREILMERGLYRGEKNDGVLARYFLVDRESFLHENPVLQKFKIPSDFQFAIQPYGWLANTDAAIDLQSKLIFLPESSLWELSEDAEISILHETIHAQLHELRKTSRRLLFPFAFTFEAPLQEKLRPYLVSYTDGIFTGEEILVRVVTTAYKLERICQGQRSGLRDMHLVNDVLGVISYSTIYLQDILPTLKKGLSKTKAFEVDLVDGVLIPKINAPGLRLRMDSEEWSRRLTQDRRASTILQSHLRFEETLIERSKKLFTPMMNSIVTLFDKNEDVEWKNFCGELPALWKIAEDSGLDTRELR